MNNTKKTALIIGIFLIFPALVFAAPSEENKMMKREDVIKQIEAQKEKVKEGIETKKTERQAERTEKTEERPEKKEARQQVACENITEKFAERLTLFTEDKQAWQESKTERSTERVEKREDRDETLAETRNQAKERRDKMYQNLLNKATSEEQKAAVETFRVGVEKAVLVRQQSIDQAVQNFRVSADAARMSKKDPRTEALDTFQGAVSSALTQVKNDCEEGLSPQDVQSAYRKSIKEAQEVLKNIRGEEILGTELKALAETRNSAVRQAIADYRTTLDTLLKNLKEVLGSQEDTSTGS